MRIRLARGPALTLASTLALSACSQAPSPSQSTAPANQVVAAKPVAVTSEAPAGTYQVDLNHADLSFSVMHLGLAPYVARFKQYDAQLDLRPQDWSRSSIRITLDPKSVTTSYTGDYKATHKKSAFDSWEEDLARSERFLMADQHPEVRYQSTSVTPTSDGRLKIEGELNLRGQTHPMTMWAEIIGSTAAHRFTQAGAIGFVAHGRFKRSQFGMDFMQGPGLLGDEVSVNFQGEFHQQVN